MKKLLAILLALTGVASVSCDHRCYYGAPEDVFEEKSGIVDDTSMTDSENATVDVTLTENNTSA